MPTIISFANALDETESGKRHILLGNGFSIACRPNIFQYIKLFEQAKFKNLPRAKALFNALGTTDFERVIRALRDFAVLAPTYYPKGASGGRHAAADADMLREVLVQTIADSHPSRPDDIKKTEYASAKAFLFHFKRIFTLNYDLLLYWTLMRNEIAPVIPCDDGFRKPEGDPEAGYVTWEPENSFDQNVYYLHGALHLFDAGSELQKYTWVNTGVALIDQIRKALAENKFPEFVSEGSNVEKFTHIRHSDYLSKAYRSFLQIGGSLFVYGHGMAENDEHILRAIEHNKVSALYVSIYGDPASTINKHIIRRASAMPARRKNRQKLKVNFFSADTTPVWKS